MSDVDLVDLLPGVECWARCEPCGVDFRLCVTVPCPVDVYCAALRAARCPTCGKKGKNLFAYEPGRRPGEVNTR